MVAVMLEHEPEPSTALVSSMCLSASMLRDVPFKEDGSHSRALLPVLGKPVGLNKHELTLAAAHDTHSSMPHRV